MDPGRFGWIEEGKNLKFPEITYTTGNKAAT